MIVTLRLKDHFSVHKYYKECFTWNNSKMCEKSQKYII